MPIFLDDCDLYPCRSLLQGLVIPCFVRRESPLSRRCVWEQRFFTHVVGIRDGVMFRKMETRRRVLEDVAESYCLDDNDYSRPAESALAIRTVALTTRALLAWIVHKRSVTDTEKDAALSRRWWQCLMMVGHAAQNGAATMEHHQLPSITVNGVEMRVFPNGKIHVGACLAHWPAFDQEWDSLRVSSRSLGISPFADGPLVSLTDFLHF